MTDKRNEALKLAQDWYDSGNENPDDFADMIKKVIALAEQPAQQQVEHCIWARNGNQPCPHVHPAQQESEAVKAAWMAGYTECEREAIEKAQRQEPVGYWQGKFSEDGGATLYEVPQVSYFGRTYPNIPLYTSPPASKPWVGLTEDERTDICEGYGANIHWRAFRAIEAKLREKNAAPCKPLTEDEAVSAVSSVLPVTSTGGQRHYFQIQRKYALEITRAIEAAHGITGESK